MSARAERQDRDPVAELLEWGSDNFDHLPMASNNALAEIHRNLRRDYVRKVRPDEVRDFPANTCAASRTVQGWADTIRQQRFPLLNDCGFSADEIADNLDAVVAALWKLRSEAANADKPAAATAQRPGPGYVTLRVEVRGFLDTADGSIECQDHMRVAVSFSERLLEQSAALDDHLEAEVRRSLGASKNWIEREPWSAFMRAALARRAAASAGALKEGG